MLGSGGLRGAYGGGVAATLGRKLGQDYFDSVYGCSAGAYTASYLASGQPDMIEAIWRKCAHGELLMRWRNMFRSGQPILDLFYLNNVLRSSAYRLSTKNLLSSSVKLFMVATECRYGNTRYFSPTTPEEFFLYVRASAAVPYLHPSVAIDGEEYIDGRLSDPLPIEKALSDGHDEIIVVCNRPQLEMSGLNLFLSCLCTMKYPGRQQMLRSLAKMREIGDLVQKYSTRVQVILPSTEPSVRWQFDSSSAHINQLVDLGIRAALTFLA
ncbi:MAG: hypothetical protein A3D65_03090 [Candidatus Lloydbacteria bacterium RIFCSPHIGHO2_02_FULL_50_13]|uniref:PNPLA domain-containing protein n=1 Tax=Candidatus Lloydbacteria bacterium RIFCSPHIGHO2_02_FULL_50_13 TaxID=1798661 RepID=A0A1G2D9Q1_9BACT|nr:MAG: hypothetical protein A3D65_03090 [Candidatus Lloydbacteria bacterium RIFCSPHIGHO2_02_FULL_50_13]